MSQVMRSATRARDRVALHCDRHDKHAPALESRDPRDRHERLATAHQHHLGPGPTVIQQPLDTTNGFYRDAWVS